MIGLVHFGLALADVIRPYDGEKILQRLRHESAAGKKLRHREEIGFFSDNLSTGRSGRFVCGFLAHGMLVWLSSSHLQDSQLNLDIL